MPEENIQPENDDKKPRIAIVDYNLNALERLEKYKGYDQVLCEKCNKAIDIRNLYHCKECFEKETDEKEKNRIMFAICKECLQPNTGYDIWCLHCNSKHFQQNFDKWTSGNKDIDELIKTKQLTAKEHYHVIEWIPYKRFTEIKYIAKGSFTKVYSAIWADGCIYQWNQNFNDWERKGPLKVALKMLNDSKDIREEFLGLVSKILI